MVSWYFKAIDCINNQKEVPYYIESKIRDLWVYLSSKEKKELIERVLYSKKPSLGFRYLNKNKILSEVFRPLYSLQRVPQNKHKSKNALEHTLRVIDTVPADNKLLRWVALFHDLGKHDSYVKDNNFIKHAYYSAEITNLYMSYIFKLPEAKKIIKIVQNHMLPLDYQRNPVWDTTTILRFIERCGKEYVIDTIDFSYYDKKSENDYPEYLKPISTLKEIIKDYV